MCRKLIVLTSFILMLGLVGANTAFGTVIDIRIADGGDDAEQHLDDGSMDITSTDLEIPYEDAGSPTTDEQAVGLRFVGVPLEADAIIADAYIEIEVDKVNKEGSQAPVNLIIEGELALDAAPFEDVANNITDRLTTATKVKWSIPEWTEQDVKYQSPNVSGIIEEIISQEGWTSGSAIILIIRDDKDNPSTGLREAEAYEGEAGAAPMLRIMLASEVDIRIADGGDDAEEHLDDGDMDITSTDLEIPYEDAGSPTTDEQVIGLRFLDVPMDQGGKVIGAYIEVEVDKVDKEGSQAPVNVIIEGELVPNAAPFEDAAGNISARVTTVTKVKWSIPEWTEQNAKFQSPDISGVIQEVVDQEGWEAGNAIVLIIRDDKDDPSTGLREAEAFEGEADAAPLLHITGGLSIVRIATEPVPADGAIGVSAAPVLSTFVSGDVPKAIPDWRWTTGGNFEGEATATLDVPDAIAIKDLNVELDITMSGDNNADLNVYIKSPDGKRVKLFDDVGLNSSHFRNTIFDDEASASIANAKGPFTGICKPEGKLSDLDGRNSKGTWKLEITDDWPNGAATLNSLRVVIENPIMISWLPGFDAASQDVYLSSSFDDVNDSVALLGNVPGNAGTIDVGSLEMGTTYYWRVDTIASDGSLYVGDIWSFSTAFGNVVIDQKVLAGNDDGEDHIAYGDVADDGAESRGSSDLEMPWDGSDYQVVGLRFADMMVPKGLSIVIAYVQFTADNEKLTGGPVNLIINGLLQPDTDGLKSGENFSEREPKTSAEVSWTDIPAWTSSTATLESRTPDISDIVKEIIGQDEWAEGNALMLFIRDDETNPSAATRSALAADEGAAVAPLLHIAGVTEAAGNPSPADGAVDVVQQTVLRWSPGLTGVSRDVYFGTSSNPPKLGRTTGTSYDVGKLVVSTTYYWKIDEYDASGKKHAGAVWSFTTLIGEATNPYPANNAKAVPINVVLTWTPGATAVSHDGYIGTTDPPPFLGNTTENSFDTTEIGGLEPGTTYYWRLDAIEAGGTKHIGDVWSFTTITLTAYDPNPADGATGVATDVELSWKPGLDAKLHAVYFGDDLDTVSNAVGAVPMPFMTYKPGPLEQGKTYYWRVDEFNPPTTTTGDIWSFTTVEPEPEPEPEPVPVL